MTVKKYRTKPVEIEAVQITDATFDDPHPNPEHVTGVTYDPKGRCVYVDGLEGRLRGEIGDYVIIASGELHLSKPDDFETHCEPAESWDVLVDDPDMLSRHEFRDLEAPNAKAAGIRAAEEAIRREGFRVVASHPAGDERVLGAAPEVAVYASVHRPGEHPDIDYGQPAPVVVLTGAIDGNGLPEFRYERDAVAEEAVSDVG